MRFFDGFWRRTPGPPPFSSMNSTPPCVDAFGFVLPNATKNCDRPALCTCKRLRSQTLEPQGCGGTGPVFRTYQRHLIARPPARELLQPCRRPGRRSQDIQWVRKKLMSRLANSKQIDLCFSYQARGLPNFRIGIPSSDFPRELFHLSREHWIGTNGQAQPVPKRIACCARAPYSRSRPGAGARICAVSFDLALTRQAACSPFEGTASMTWSSSCSIC